MASAILNSGWYIVITISRLVVMDVIVRVVIHTL